MGAVPSASPGALTASKETAIAAHLGEQRRCDPFSGSTEKRCEAARSRLELACRRRSRNDSKPTAEPAIALERFASRHYDRRAMRPNKFDRYIELLCERCSAFPKMSSVRMLQGGPVYAFGSGYRDPYRQQQICHSRQMILGLTRIASP